MKFNIFWSERKTTSTGKEQIKATLKDGEKTIEGVTIWADFPKFTELMTGHDVEGDLVPSKDPKWGPTLYAPKDQQVGHPVRSPGAINKAMEKKAENIAVAQDNKANSIKVASTMSMAVNTALAFLQGETIKDAGVFKSQVEKWREYYWLKWDAEDKDFPAF
jgi:hypothetical protein